MNWNLLRSQQYKKLIGSAKKTTDQSVCLQRYPKISKKYIVSKWPHTLVTFSRNSAQVRKTYICQSTLLRMVENWESAIDTDSLLIAKMADYGFHLSACKLIARYLHTRKQCVKIQGNRSAWSDVVKDVPQGSILGPLLFNIIINDIFVLDMSCSIYNYANEYCISYSHNNVDCIKSAFRDETNSLMTWFKLNSLEANHNKFQSMPISSKALNDNEIFDWEIKVSNNVITATSTMNILGIHIDSKLNLLSCAPKQVGN